MSVPRAAFLKRAGERFPAPASVSAFVQELESNWPTQTGPSSPASPTQTIQASIVMIGNNLRLRAISNGGVIEVLGIDGLWHQQHQYSIP